jgi:GT2 family glycosyltransferase
VNFSIIITTYKRPEALAGCLEALAGLDYARGGFEVVVVDDGGDRPLDDVVEPFCRRMEVTLLRQEHGGAARGRNRGVQAARGCYLAFTDDDCRPAPGWLRAFEAALARRPDALAGGRTTNGLTGNLCSSASQLIMDIVYDHYNPDPENARFFATCNLALPTRSFRELGGFDEGYVLHACEDRDLCDRWRHRGWPLIYVPEAVARHQHHLDLPGFCRQHFTYGRGAVRFHRQRRWRGSGRLWKELGFHFRIGRWLFRPFREASGRRALGLLGLLLLWQVVNTAGYFYEWLRQLKGFSDRA